jgi:hypothetical protein
MNEQRPSHPLEAPQNWQEVDGEVLPPETQVDIAPNQVYINDADLRHDHSEFDPAVAPSKPVPAGHEPYEPMTDKARQIGRRHLRIIRDQ